MSGAQGMFARAMQSAAIIEPKLDEPRAAYVCSRQKEHNHGNHDAGWSLSARHEEYRRSLLYISHAHGTSPRALHSRAVTFTGRGERAIQNTAALEKVLEEPGPNYAR